jgi:Rrf2 family protein
MRNASSAVTARPLLSRTGEHALRAALYLGGRAERRLASAQEVARALGTPPNYTGKVLRALARKGLLRSVRGPRGGFELRVPAQELSLAAVLDAADEPEVGPAVCLLGDRPCNADAPCRAHRKWSEVLERAHELIERTTLADLLGVDPTTSSVAVLNPDENQPGGDHA